MAIADAQHGEQGGVRGGPPGPVALHRVSFHVTARSHRPLARPKQAAQVAGIASYWANLTSRKPRNPHNIGEDGVMGEVASGLPILLRCPT